MADNQQSGDAGRAARRRLDRRPTMADVAARAGVSRALVSLVFRNAPGASEQTRQRVFQVAEELGYRPDNAARMLASTRTKVLGVMMTVHNPYQADLVEGIYAEAERLGYDILLSATAPSRDEHKAIEALLSHRCEALILLGPQSKAEYLADLGAQVPVVVVGLKVPRAPVDSVHTAETRGVRQAIDYLVEQGHRDIVHIDGGSWPGSADRRRAYRSAMRKHQLGANVRVIPGDHTEASGINAAALLLKEQALPTAILASNDRCALGLLGSLNKAAVKVPEELSVVGYDDSHIVMLSHINLTTVHQDAEGIAQRAVQAAVERIESPDMEPRELVLEPKLMVRGTSGPPRA